LVSLAETADGAVDGSDFITTLGRDIAGSVPSYLLCPIRVSRRRCQERKPLRPGRGDEHQHRENSSAKLGVVQLETLSTAWIKKRALERIPHEESNFIDLPLFFDSWNGFRREF
jgi:hypothetical protein